MIKLRVGSKEEADKVVAEMIRQTPESVKDRPAYPLICEMSVEVHPDIPKGKGVLMDGWRVLDILDLEAGNE